MKPTGLAPLAALLTTFALTAPDAAAQGRTFVPQPRVPRVPGADPGAEPEPEPPRPPLPDLADVAYHPEAATVTGRLAPTRFRPDTGRAAVLLPGDPVSGATPTEVAAGAVAADGTFEVTLPQRLLDGQPRRLEVRVSARSLLGAPFRLTAALEATLTATAPVEVERAFPRWVPREEFEDKVRQYEGALLGLSYAGVSWVAKLRFPSRHRADAFTRDADEAFRARVPEVPEHTLTGTVGRPLAAQIQVQGGSGGPVLFSVWGKVPAGVTIDRHGLFSGTPQETGTFTYRVIVLDRASMRGVGSVTLVIEEAQRRRGVRRP